jgi:hypothetical protein
MVALISIACTPTNPPSPPPSPEATPVATPKASPPASTPTKTISKVGLMEHLDFTQPLTNLTKSITEKEGVSKTKDRFDRTDQALSLSGDRSFLKLDIDINPAAVPQLTMAVWVKYTGDTTAQQNQSFQVISHDDGNFDRSLGIDNRAGSWGWSAFAGENEPNVLGGLPITANRWVFLAVTYGDDAVVLYVDGKKVADKKNAVMGTGKDFLMLGSNPEFGEHFQGDIDDVFLYRRKLTDAEISELYEITKEPF